MRNPPIVVGNSTTSESSNGMIKIGKEPMSGKDRVALQRYHNEEIHVTGETAIPDQGIRFDDNGQP